MSCAAPEGGVSLDGVDVATQAIIQGVVTRGGEPLRAYVRLLDRTGEFRFFAATGGWTLRVLAPRTDAVDRVVSAQLGQITEVAIDLAAVSAPA